MIMETPVCFPRRKLRNCTTDYAPVSSGTNCLHRIEIANTIDNSLNSNNTAIVV